MMSSATDKRERFERLAQKRITETIKNLGLAGNLANRNNHSYTAEHVRQILEVLDSQMRSLRQQFNWQTKDDTGEFRFKKYALEERRECDR